MNENFLPTLLVRLLLTLEKVGCFFNLLKYFCFIWRILSLLTTYNTSSKLTTSIWNTLVDQVGGSSSPATRGYLGEAHQPRLCPKSLSSPAVQNYI